ncbi:MAG: DUF4864 domain-containing protein [Rhodobacteraceae bacterium]|nr:DUF4864 domain-containing protein [Paracoccaceae bacterium]
MKTLIFAAFLSIAPVAAPAQTLSSPDIESVISRQIDAFLRDDFEAAFAFASPMIKGIFQTPERFGRMVVDGYPMVWRPSDMRFMELRHEDGRLFQKVMLRDADGRVHYLDYEMIEGGDGWQINSVQLLRAPTLGV